MNTYMNWVIQEMFSYFDTGRATESEPERIRKYGFAFCEKEVLIGTAEK